MNDKKFKISSRYKRGRNRRAVVITDVVMVVIGVVTGAFLLVREPQAPAETPVLSSVQYEESPAAMQPGPETTPWTSFGPDAPVIEPLYPVGKLSVSKERQDYADGDMVLSIPRLELVSPVLSGTSQATLNKGVGLFDYAQLPGPYNSNTSLAAHRDIYGCEFYYIHTITGGDLMYLSYKGKMYTYEYMETFITNDSDWEPIKARDFPCVTLMSCDPIGTSLNRIIVVGRLVGAEDEE